MGQEQSIEQKITELANVKFSMNCQITEHTSHHFTSLKQCLRKLAEHITEVLQTKDKKYKSTYFEADDNQAEIQIGEDTVWFHLHPNLFRINEANPAYRFSYLKDDINRAHCAVIIVYNFLTDTLVNKRENDLGILIARIFVNVDHHFIVETRKPMGINYNDLANDVLDDAKIKI